jgi:hypothetical protein
VRLACSLRSRLPAARRPTPPAHRSLFSIKGGTTLLPNSVGATSNNERSKGPAVAF